MDEGQGAGGTAGRLSVAFVSHFVPYPPIGGAFQRNYNLLRLIAREHDIHLLAVRHKKIVYPSVSIDDAIEALRPLCASLEIVDLSHRTSPVTLALGAALSMATGEALSVRLYRSDALRSAIRRAAARVRPSVLHLDTIGLAQYLDEAAGAATVLGHHNVESAFLRRRVAFEGNPLARVFFRHEASRLAAYERAMCPRADINVTVSGDDAAQLARETGGRVAVVSNGVDIDAFVPVRRQPGSRTLVFAGRQDQPANHDAIRHFAHAAWPAIREAVPDARLLVVGANPPPDVQALASPESGIEVTGFVQDVRPYFERAAAVVIPLRDGGGTRLKVIDAMALGMPVLSTTFGVSGLDLEPDRDVLIADDPAAFATQTVRLFNDEQLQTRLGARARTIAEQRFGWQRIALDLSAVYRGAVQRRAAAADGVGA